MQTFSIDTSRFVAIDIETTGISIRDDRICEIGAVSFDTGEKKSFSTLVNPQIAIKKNVLGIHGISDRMVASAPTFKKITQTLEKFFQDAVIVGHNLYAFDISFLNKEMYLAGRSPFFNPLLDTYYLSQRVFPQFKKRSLKDLAKTLGIKVNIVHRALPDAALTLEIWLKLREELKILHYANLDYNLFLLPLKKFLREKAVHIIDAAQKNARISIVYRSHFNEITKREIEFIALRGNKLDAFCHLRNDFRTFELKKILQVQ